MKKEGEWDEKGEREREKLRSCITLNLPEYLPPSEPYGVYPLTNAHGTQASSSLLSLSFSFSLFVSLSLFFLPSSSRLFPVLLSSGRSSFLRSNLALALSARFLFSSYSSPPLAELTHPFLTLCTVYRVSAEYLSDIDSKRRRGRDATRTARCFRRAMRTRPSYCSWPSIV